jgi:hypothetical protein
MDTLQAQILKYLMPPFGFPLEQAWLHQRMLVLSV